MLSYGGVPPTDTSGVSHGPSKGLIQYSFETITVLHFAGRFLQATRPGFTTRLQCLITNKTCSKIPSGSIIDPYLFCGGEGGIVFFSAWCGDKTCQFLPTIDRDAVCGVLSVLVMLDKTLG